MTSSSFGGLDHWSKVHQILIERRLLNWGRVESIGTSQLLPRDGSQVATMRSIARSLMWFSMDNFVTPSMDIQCRSLSISSINSSTNVCVSRKILTVSRRRFLLSQKIGSRSRSRQQGRKAPHLNSTEPMRPATSLDLVVKWPNILFQDHSLNLSR